MEESKGSDDTDQQHCLLDRVLPLTGGFGRWQLFFVILSAWSCVISASNHGSVLFLAASPDFQCADNVGNSEDSENQCLNDDGNACSEFTYNTTEVVTSFVTKWDLVCSKLFYVPFIQSTYFAGVIVGNLFGGTASDVLGRRKALLVSCIGHMICAHTLTFVHNYFLLLVMRFIIGGTAHAVFAVLSVACIEVVTIHRRTFAMGIIQAGWKIGFAILAGLAYYFRQWEHLQIGIALLNLPMIAYFFVVPESPRWLLATGSVEEAKEVFCKIAKWNGADKSDGFKKDFSVVWDELVKTHANTGATVSLKSHLRTTWQQVKEILITPLARSRFVLCMFPWFVAGLSYYGIFLSVKFVSVNKYALVVISSAVEIPVLFFMSWVLDTAVGRIKAMIVIYILGGCIGLSLLATPEDDLYIRPVILVIGKTLSTVYWLGCGLQSSEIFPTSIRTMAFCLLDVTSKFGATLAPFLVDLLANIDNKLPNIIIGALSLVTALVFLFMPETKDEDIPETVHDMAEMKKVIVKCKGCI